MDNINKNLYSTVGLNIKKIRKVRKLGQEELANMISLSRSSVSNIESGKHQPSLSVIYELAAALDCELHELLPSVKTFNTFKSLIEDKYLNVITSKYSNMSNESLNFLKEILQDDEK
ncbi:DNA-binding XRE family transcriptional regulator [Tenacibaculum adriaticum]|uniref:DNA-binding XRE family transcriptional regulator n=1 Tax=Tenacibaculum adriaticum TaxID=413713 RepID=A0A5S5DWX9_9FLAO|nr:helix-turn-helix transcriptional regulator [Tenacibaculum adriaticum]TYQ00235.1 DNA-binding XRE family transcriptional regulator [Tenacibaculum adriaticum]